MDLSVIIAARQEKYLQRTIDSVLAASERDTEVIVVLDGAWPEEPIPNNPRVVILFHPESRGQRQSINEAARIARGRFIMKLDAHCAVSPGFDRVLIDSHRPGVTQVPRMFNLDVETWQPKTHKRTDYMYIGWNDKGELRTLYYGGRDWKRWHARAEQFDETMSCMGPGWFLSLEDFWAQGGCDEGHGSWGSQGIEVSLKAWLIGEGLYVNKGCWFAHWFRAEAGGFPYPISGKAIEHARKYAAELWTANQCPGQKRTLQWLLDKFDPPGWEGYVDQATIDDLNVKLYRHIHLQKREPTWRGVRVIKMPSDMILYAQVIQQNKPRWIIECGTKFGGSALYLQDMLDIVGEGGRVITIDKYPVADLHHDPRITYITGSSTDPDLVAGIRETVEGTPVMVILDSDHSRVHVKWELKRWSPLVTPGQFLVIEDCYSQSADLYGPGEARDWFLGDGIGDQFIQTNLDRQFAVGFCRGGWLRRK